MLEDLFDDAADDMELAEFLGSPTRQAVALARAYNSRERKLQVNSTSRAEELYEEDGDEHPAFIQVIEKLRDAADRKGLLLNNREKYSAWAPEQEQIKPEEQIEPEEQPQELQQQVEPTEDNTEFPYASALKSAPEWILSGRISEKLENVAPYDEELIFDDMPPFDTQDFEEKSEAAVPVSEENPEPVEAVVSMRNPEEPERKTNIALAILYAIVAVPITVALCCVLLAPTFASLGASGLCVYTGIRVTAAAFGGFSMFSDMMVVLGSGIILLALGLLFLWLFIWFIGGAIAGVINGALELGGRLCSKEVR